MGTRHTSTIAMLIAAVVVAGLLPGCTKGGGGSTPASGSPSAGSSSPSTSGSGSPGGDTSASPGTAPSRSKATTQAGEVTVTGQVEEGVEGGCLMLRTTSKLYQLVGGDRAKLAAGGRVTVRGRVVTDMVTTCQQGIPLQVLDVQPA